MSDVKNSKGPSQFKKAPQKKKAPPQEDRVDRYINTGIHTLITVGLILLGGTLIYRYYQVRIKKEEYKASCIARTEDRVMRKPYLRGLLDEREEYRVAFYEEGCGDFTYGDLALYQVSTTTAPIIRVVRAVPGAVIELKPAVNGKSWSLMVNGAFVRDYRGEVYYFGSYPTLPPLGLYIKNNGKMLGEDHYLLFSTVSPGVNDSGQFGIVTRHRMLGRVIDFD